MVRLRLAGPIAAALAALAAPALASFHLLRIVQVYGGDESHPDGQFVVAPGCSDFQNLVSGHPVVFFDAAGVEVGSATFAADLPDTGTNQEEGPDRGRAPPRPLSGRGGPAHAAGLLLSGGKVCFDPAFPLHGVDCFAWGDYAALPDPAVGNPFDPVGGLPLGDAPSRDLARAAGPRPSNAARRRPATTATTARRISTRAPRDPSTMPGRPACSTPTWSSSTASKPARPRAGRPWCPDQGAATRTRASSASELSRAPARNGLTSISTIAG